MPLKKPRVQLQWPSCMTFNTAENLLVQVKEKGQLEDAHIILTLIDPKCLALFYLILMGKIFMDLSVDDTLSHSTLKHY